MKPVFSLRRDFAVFALVLGALAAGGAGTLLGVCGPFTDVSDAAFCPFVLEVFTLGITTGTSPTTYDPATSVSRLQMAAFLSRSVDGVLKRGGRRAALQQFWTSQNSGALGVTTVGVNAQQVQSDGTDVWAPENATGHVSRVRGSDGKLLETWTGAFGAWNVLSAMGKVFVSSSHTPNTELYRIDPTQPAGVVTTVATNLGNFGAGMTFDGARIWTANLAGASVSIVTSGLSIPWTVTTVTTGFTAPVGASYDGANVWVTDATAGTLLKLGGNGAILQTVTVGTNPEYPAFDGSNIWVPNYGSQSVSVVRASNGAVLATLTGNGLMFPRSAAFDGQRVLITNTDSNNVSLFKSADLTPLASVGTGLNSNPTGVCSDGLNFWIMLTYASSPNSQLARF